MRRIVAAINMTLDGFCDHTAIMADDEMHEHYTELLSNAGTILYGRITYQLMEYWRDLVKNPTGQKAEDDFALIMDKVPKIVFSRTLKSVDWKSATLARNELKEEVSELREKDGNDILIGSPSLIVELTELGMVDEYQLCIHPVLLGKGLPLFKNLYSKKFLKLVKTKTFGSGAMVHYYESTDH